MLLAWKRFAEGETHVSVKTNLFEFTIKVVHCDKLALHHLIKQDIKPARAQVLNTKPIKNCMFKVLFHVDEGLLLFQKYNE